MSRAGRRRRYRARMTRLRAVTRGLRRLGVIVLGPPVFVFEIRRRIVGVVDDD